jgi:hypothetical protein
LPSVAKEKQSYHLSKLRSLRAEDHQIEFEELCAQLDQRYGLKLDRHYVTKLAKKLYAERAKRADRYTLNATLTAFQDTMTQVVRVAWSIANDPFAKNQDRIAALKEVREANNAVFEKLFDAGVFERKLGTLDATIRNTPLPEERKQAIRAVFTNWGLLAEPAIAPSSSAAESAAQEPTPVP